MTEPLPRPVDAMIIPPSNEPSSLCVGSTKNLCAGWLCVFEGTEDECRQYFQDGNVPIEYDRVFMMNRYRETVLRPAPQPVPVSERLPGLEDCDEQGRCWAWRSFDPEVDDLGDFWLLIPCEWLENFSRWTHWLSANALPTPEAKP